MRILILGGDGYLGWPTAMHLAATGHDVHVVDNYFKRRMALDVGSEPLFPTPNLNDRAEIYRPASGYNIDITIGDCCDYPTLERIVRDTQPETIIHYAEQPSAPYSMIGFKEARQTLVNNLTSTFNLIWAVLENTPDCHIVKLGTMGEYGTPNIDIEEGWLDIEHNGRKERLLYPRTPGSLYHTTKVSGTDLIWFYVRNYNMRVTDLMQGPVYGIHTPQTKMDKRLYPSFYYDDIFGTVLNRFVTQAVAGVPLTVYGMGEQTRGFINLIDTLQCVELSTVTPAHPGELRIFNQFTEIFTINELAQKVKKVGDKLGFNVKIRNIENPRKEKEKHYYNVVSTGLKDLGLQSHNLTDEVVGSLLETVSCYRDSIDKRLILPRVKWVKTQ